MPDAMDRVEKRTVIRTRAESFKEPARRWSEEGGLIGMFLNRLKKFGKHNTELKKKLLG